MNKSMIIFGSAPNVTEDIARIPRPDYFDFMAVGIDAIDKFSGPIKYVASNHKEDIAGIRGKTDAIIISCDIYPGVDIVVEPPNPSGSSALVAVLAALTLGYKKIILCGCPLTGNAPEGNPYEAFRPGWAALFETLEGNVKSMSGWTQELLGAPRASWLIPKISFASCWDGRDYYPAHYVNTMFNMCARNTTVPFEYILYIGPEAENKRAQINPDIRIHQTGLPYWWCGMQIWQETPPAFTTTDILYMDLDQVVVGPLDEIITFPSDLAAMKDYPPWACPKGKEKDICVSTTLIRQNAGARVWEEYVKAGKPQWDPLHIPVGAPLRMAAQELMNKHLSPVRLPATWVCSYRIWAKAKGLPEDCKIVAFHGRPKQHEVDDEWVKEHWR